MCAMHFTAMILNACALCIHDSLALERKKKERERRRRKNWKEKKINAAAGAS